MTEPGTISCRLWDEAAWLAARDLWADLLQRSDADQLFLSWDWQTLWWQNFGAAGGHELFMLAVYRDTKLIGIAPLHRTHVTRRGIAVRSLQVVGSSWRDPNALLSEYLDVIADRSEVDTVRRCVLAKVLHESFDCDEIIIANTREGEEWATSLPREAGRGHARRVDIATSYQADLSGGFARYLETLSASARRALWNLRRRLSARGEVRLEKVESADLEAGFIGLNRLHAQRWGGELFSGARLRFHREFAARLSMRNQLALSRLVVGGEVVSMLYDVRIGSRQYNIQMGFDPQFDAAISPGLLHLGYAMEAAADQGVLVYDFLAGPGRSEDYKARISQRSQRIECVQYLRGGWLPHLYRWHGALKAYFS